MRLLVTAFRRVVTIGVWPTTSSNVCGRYLRARTRVASCSRARAGRGPPPRRARLEIGATRPGLPRAPVVLPQLKAVAISCVRGRGTCRSHGGPAYSQGLLPGDSGPALVRPDAHGSPRRTRKSIRSSGTGRVEG